MGLKDSLQHVLARLAGGTSLSDRSPAVCEDGAIEESCRALESKLGYTFRNQTRGIKKLNLFIYSAFFYSSKKY